MKTISTCRDGTLKNKQNDMGMTPQYFHTIPTPCTILPTMLHICCVIEGLWKAVECICSAGCVVRVGKHGD